ncbi:MAG: NAD(P)H-binding protein [Crocinitomix sp.]|nr:NAD(P)H-binding protein [Crocinitomix sp.]
MKAILIGATGLIGKALLNALLSDDSFTEVRVLTRRATGATHDKLIEEIVDFDQIKSSGLVLKSDVLFSTLGTTMKTAGTKEKQWTIDFDMQINTAQLASNAGTQKLVLLSSAGATAKSKIFYSRMKGELDEAVQKLNFEQISIIRPSMLAGKREEFRWAEKIFTPIMYAFSWIPGIRKYRPIKDVTVAKAMINASKEQVEDYAVYELQGVFDLAK